MNSARDELKDWKLLQGALGFLALAGGLYYVTSDSFKLREWVPLVPPSPTPDSLIFQVDALRQNLQKQQYASALEHADTILAKDAHHPEAFRARSVCLVRLGRFQEAEAPLRILIGQNKNDLTSRLLLGITLRGKGDNARARDVLLRLLDHPLITPIQKQTIQSILASMSGVDPLFADRPTPTPAPTPSPQAPSPEPSLAPIKVSAPKGFLPATPTPPWLNKPTTPTPEPTPIPMDGPLILPSPGMTTVEPAKPARVILPATANSTPKKIASKKIASKKIASKKIASKTKPKPKRRVRRTRAKTRRVSP